ncbi:hypothetical protein [Chryseobacterium indologenes]|uniref:hypothetical protein n=2 Tax=Chryseobacterium indologenes TaxID=253 RepID=UPI000550CF03|nr:hypothetical protein [Chryseobacterium indologenes]
MIKKQMTTRFLLLFIVLGLISCKKSNNPMETQINPFQDTISLNDSIISVRNYRLKTLITKKWTYDTYSDSSDSMFEYFTLDLKNEKDSVIGRYCAKADKGKILDCSNTGYNIHGRIVNGKIIAEFYSFLGSKENKGMAELQLINSNYLEWKIIKAPKPPYHFPKNILLFAGNTSKHCNYPGGPRRRN